MGLGDSPWGCQDQELQVKQLLLESSMLQQTWRKYINLFSSGGLVLSRLQHLGLHVLAAGASKLLPRYSWADK